MQSSHRDAESWVSVPENFAMLVVDMQNFWLHPQGIAYDAKLLHVVPKIRSAIDYAHKNGIPVIYLYTAYRNDLSDAGLYPELGLYEGRMFNANEKWSLFERTEGAKIIEELLPTDHDIVLKKTRYSGFIGTPLEQILRGLKKGTLLITGISSNICCESTAREAMMRDFRIILLSDCTMSRSEEAHNRTIATINRNFGLARSLNEVMDAGRKKN